MKLIEEGCSNKNPCLVFLAWSLRSSRLVLVAPTFPALSTSVPTPEFIFVYASWVVKTCPAEYLHNGAWISDFKATLKVVGFRADDETMVEKSRNACCCCFIRYYIFTSLTTSMIEGSITGRWTLFRKILHPWLQKSALLVTLLTISSFKGFTSACWWYSRRMHMSTCSNLY